MLWAPLRTARSCCDIRTCRKRNTLTQQTRCSCFEALQLSTYERDQWAVPLSDAHIALERTLSMPLAGLDGYNASRSVQSWLSSVAKKSMWTSLHDQCQSTRAQPHMRATCTGASTTWNFGQKLQTKIPSPSLLAHFTEGSTRSGWCAVADRLWLV